MPIALTAMANACDLCNLINMPLVDSKHKHFTALIVLAFAWILYSYTVQTYQYIHVLIYSFDGCKLNYAINLSLVIHVDVRYLTFFV